MRSKTLTVILACVAMFAFAACDVEQTEEGNVPEYEVEQTEEGNMPEYDVDTPEVDVEMEEETVEVPDVDVDPADEGMDN